MWMYEAINSEVNSRIFQIITIIEEEYLPIQNTKFQSDKLEQSKALSGASYCILYMCKHELVSPTTFGNDIMEYIYQLPKQFVDLFYYLSTGVIPANMILITNTNNMNVNTNTHTPTSAFTANTNTNEFIEIENENGNKLKKKLTTKQILLRKIMNTIGISLGPTLYTLLDILRSYLFTIKFIGNDKLVLINYENIVSCIICDISIPTLSKSRRVSTNSNNSNNGNNKYSGSSISNNIINDSIYSQKIQFKIQLCAIDIIQHLFGVYKPLRTNMLIEILPILVHIYNTKSIQKPILLRARMNGIVNPISIACITVLQLFTSCMYTDMSSLTSTIAKNNMNEKLLSEMLLNCNLFIIELLKVLL